MKRQSMKWEKISTNCIADKALIPKIYRELLQLISKKKTHTQITQFKKWAKKVNTLFPKKEIKWPTGIQKAVQRYESSRKCKSKSQQDITSHLSGWVL